MKIIKNTIGDKPIIVQKVEVYKYEDFNIEPENLSHYNKLLEVVKILIRELQTREPIYYDCEELVVEKTTKVVVKKTIVKNILYFLYYTVQFLIPILITEPKNFENLKINLTDLGKTLTNLFV